MKLLIVDDDRDALDVAKIRLAKENVAIVCADGGAAGLKAARSEQPDLILLDLDMPDMSGFDVCRALKADAELCMIPVLFLSGSTTAEDKIHGLDLGAVDYVTKPFDAFELRARVRAALRTKHLQDMLFEHAHIDPLTGLPNRRALVERLQREWARIERHGGRLSFIMADIDHFKRVNDLSHVHKLNHRSSEMQGEEVGMGQLLSHHTDRQIILIFERGCSSPAISDLHTFINNQQGTQKVVDGKRSIGSQGDEL